MVARVPWRVRLCAAATAMLVGAGCGSGSTPPTAPPNQPPPQPQRYTVTSITDGDTLRFNPAIQGVTSLRFLNVDTPELGGNTQEPWAAAARAQLQQLLPPSSQIDIELDQERIDPFGRVLGHAIRTDGLNTNREQLRLGHAVLFVIWPNVAHFTEYRAAQIEAQASGRGIWSAASPLRELPFEFRLRTDGSTAFRPVGDFFTRSYVEPADYRQVHVNNRVFFNSRTDADAAGYRACARDATGTYSAACFASGAPAARARGDQPPPRLRRSAEASAKAEAAQRAGG